MAGSDQRPPESLWFRYNAEIGEVYEDQRNSYSLDLSYLSLIPGSIMLNGVASLVNPQGLTKFDKHGLQERVKDPNGSSREVPIKITGKPKSDAEVAGAGAAGLAGVPPGSMLQDTTRAFLQSIDLPKAPSMLQQVKKFVSDEPLLDNVGRPVLLPVADTLYYQLSIDNEDMANLLQPVSACGAQRLSALVTWVLSKPFTPATDETVLAGYIDSVLWDVLELMADCVTTTTLSLKRMRNSTGRSRTSESLRPDFLLLVHDSLLFKGEDKTDSKDLDVAVRELREKLAAWSSVYHDQVEYLLCYAAAGMSLQFCALPRDSPATTEYLGPLLDLARPLHRLQAIVTAIKLFGVLAQQATQLPGGRVCLGHSDHRTNGTTITYFDRFVQKEIDLKLQLWLRDVEARMDGIYKAAKGCNQLVQMHQGSVKVAGDVYRVFLQPLGSKLDGPPSGPALRAAIKCVLQALDWLHVRGWGHGDVRWQNVVRLTALQYVLIDLETALQLNAPPPAWPYPKIDAWGKQGEALDDGHFTARSDLYMVGAMLQGGEHLGEEGQRLRDALLAKKVPSARDALNMPWFAGEA